MGIPSFYITASDHIPDGHSTIFYNTASDQYQVSNQCFSHRLRLTLGDMFENEVPQNHEIGTERGPGGSVWAETLSK